MTGAVKKTASKEDDGQDAIETSATHVP